MASCCYGKAASEATAHERSPPPTTRRTTTTRLDRRVLVQTPDGSDDADADDGSGDDSGEDPAVDDGSGDDTTSTTDTTPVTPTTRPLGEVKVAVANGVGVSGLAGQQAQLLTTAGFVTVAVNAAANTELSAVYYIDGYALEAEAVAIELGATGAVLRAATDPGALLADASQVEGFHIFVVLGSDRVLG